MRTTARHLRAALYLAVAAVALAGCAGAQPAQPGTDPASPSAETSSPPGQSPTAGSDGALSPVPEDVDLDELELAPDGAIDEDTGEVIQSEAPPVWDESSRAAAIAAAEAVISAFASTDLDYDSWWQQLAPTLEYETQLDYAYVDPANIPVSKVTGPGTIVDDSSTYVAYVDVPTDVGTYQVWVTRQSASAPWLGVKIIHPEGAG